MSERKAVVLMLMVALVWGCGFVATQYAIDDGWLPLQLMAARFLIAGGMLAVIFNKKLKGASRYDIYGGVVSGMLLVGGFAFQTWGQMESTPAITAFVTSAYVIFVPFIDWKLYRRKPGTAVGIAALLTCAGIGLITVSGHMDIGFGVFLIMVSTVFYAFQLCALGQFVIKIDVTRITVTMLLFAGVASFVLAAVGMLFVPTLPQLSLKGTGAVVFLGVFSSALCYLGQTIGQKYISSSKTAIILSMESVFGALLSVLIYKETLPPRAIVGCAVVFFAIMLAETKFSFITKYFKIKKY